MQTLPSCKGPDSSEKLHKIARDKLAHGTPRKLPPKQYLPYYLPLTRLWLYFSVSPGGTKGNVSWTFFLIYDFGQEGSILEAWIAETISRSKPLSWVSQRSFRTLVKTLDCALLRRAGSG
jgi:hypothetical protein